VLDRARGALAVRREDVIGPVPDMGKGMVKKTTKGGAPSAGSMER